MSPSPTTSQPSPESFDFGCDLIAQDWRGHLLGHKPPPVVKQHFADRALAEAQKAARRALCPDPDLLLTVVPAAAPGRRRGGKR